MQKPEEKPDTGCCKKFNPDNWDRKTISLNKRFVHGRVITIFSIPLNFGTVLKRNMDRIKKHNAQSDDLLLLYEFRSPFHASLYISTDKDVPNGDMTTIKGEFLSKVFEGEYRDIDKWTKDMHEYVQSQSKTVKKMYLYYTTCPRCAQYYGKNYVVFLAQV